jgi:predicted acylesterase/phospholipase RssA
MTIDETRMRPVAHATAVGDLSASGAPPASDDAIGVALSGGGVRAALFSLGVLIGLVDADEQRRVSQIASVSGGSIVNAAIAQGCRFGEIDDVDDFRSTAEPIAGGLCRRGAFVFSVSGLLALLRTIATPVLTLSFVAVLVISSIDRSDVPWAWIGVTVLVGLVVAVWLLRGRLQEALYASFLATMPGNSRQLAQLAGSPTTHVIVGTDLVSGAPVYFAPEFVACPMFGWGTPGRLTTARAVYASAAFPVAFPVLRMRRKRFRFRDGGSPPPYPRVMKLTDGGVYNNLGTDWLDELVRQRDEIWAFGNLGLELAPVSQRIVVNAGAASRGFRRVVPFLSVPRTMSVLYDNTVRPRLESMRDLATRGLHGPIVIDISESPYNIARRLAELDPSPGSNGDGGDVRACRDRAVALEQELGRRGEAYWIEFARQTSSTKTKLTRAGLESGARIMLHGYLSAVVVAHVLLGARLPDLKDEGYFLELAGRGRCEQPATSPEEPLD